jgi:hypothetical protein
LVKAHAQENLQSRLLRSALGALRDEPIERCLPTHHAERQFLHERPIHGTQTRVSQRLIEQGFQPRPILRVLAQNTRGNFSWFFRVHRPIMPVALLQSSF